MTGSPLPIPLDSIEQYAARFGPSDPDGFEELAAFLTALDAAWFELIDKQGG